MKSPCVNPLSNMVLYTEGYWGLEQQASWVIIQHSILCIHLLEYLLLKIFAVLNHTALGWVPEKKKTSNPTSQ
jgi:membrane-anchored glycerophosphoryl diester phosphodiesterase (GDPDase)